ncbi:MAG TPA: response regulator transcription factor [Pyrinomonadaceae bacterium]|nr:response regulator transcription factor [Pyrinomonadaceae bacterium]
MISKPAADASRRVLSEVSITPQHRSIKILLIDNHNLVRSGIKLLIQSNPTLEVIAAESACCNVINHGLAQPDVILLAVESATDERIDCMPGLLKSFPDAAVLVLTDVKDINFHARCMRAGASGIISNDQSPELLFRAILKVHAGEIWIERGCFRSLLSVLENNSQNGHEATKIRSLTERELEIIHCIAQGLHNKQIGEKLFICEATVSHHLTTIFSKLDIPDRLALVIYSYRYGLVRLPSRSSEE